MQVVVHHAYRTNKKEPLVEMLQRILDAFNAALLVPQLTASFADSSDETRVSAVDRALKKYPDLAPLLTNESTFPGLPSTRRLAGDPLDRPISLDSVLAISKGVPRSLPFDSVRVQFGHPEFDGALGSGAGFPCGVIVGDDWWVNGRRRSMNVVYTVAADPESTDFPLPPPGAASVVEQLGPPRKTDSSISPDSADSGVVAGAIAAAEIVARYRGSIMNVLDKASLPHDLPPLADVLGAPAGSGPLKPALVAEFSRRGFDCRGEPGRFVLRRKTDLGNFVILDVDVGTWSRMVTTQYAIRGVGAHVRLWVPIGARGIDAMQYPIGDGANWERIVANLAAVVDELDRTFLPEIEAAIGRSPEWFEA